MDCANRVRIHEKEMISHHHQLAQESTNTLHPIALNKPTGSRSDDQNVRRAQYQAWLEHQLAHGHAEPPSTHIRDRCPGCSGHTHERASWKALYPSDIALSEAL